MHRFADHRGVVAVGDDQSGLSRADIVPPRRIARQMRRNRPEEAVAIIEIVEPFAVPDADRALATLISTIVKAPLASIAIMSARRPFGKRHFADREQVLAAEQPGHPARDFRGDRRGMGETGRLRAAWPSSFDRTKRQRVPKGKRASFRSPAARPLSKDSNGRRCDFRSTRRASDASPAIRSGRGRTTLADRGFLEALIDDLGHRHRGPPLRLERGTEGSECPWTNENWLRWNSTPQ